MCASVGNYLKEHGWNSGEPVLSEATVAPGKAADLDGRKLLLSETVGSLAAKGVSFDNLLPPDAPAILIAADEADGVHWRVGYNNFFVITRYNHSALYAMAVFELAAAVKQRMLVNEPGGAASSATPRRSLHPLAAPGHNRDTAVRFSRALGVPLCARSRLGMAACFSAPPRRESPSNPRRRAPRRRRNSRRRPPPYPMVPRDEPRSRNGNPPFYDVMGKRYFVLSSSVGYVERGVASWYGPGFHKVRTSTGEPYECTP